MDRSAAVLIEAVLLVLRGRNYWMIDRMFNMKRMLQKGLMCFALWAVSTNAYAISVNWGAQVDYGVATANGTAVPVGALVLIGSFGNLTTAQIASANLATLQANFINLSTTARHIGDGSPVSGATTPTAADAGFWLENNDTNSSTALGIAGKPVYYWIFNGTTMANSTQDGIFTAFNTGATTAIKANWTFKNDTDIPPTQTTDLDNVLPYTTGRTGTVIDRSAILVGSYGTGTSTATGNVFYNLALINVPEPSTVSFMIGALGLVGLVVRKRWIGV